MIQKIKDLAILFHYIADGLSFEIGYRLANDLLGERDLDRCLASYISGAIISIEDFESVDATLDDLPLGIARAYRLQTFRRYAIQRGREYSHLEAIERISR